MDVLGRAADICGSTGREFKSRQPDGGLIIVGLALTLVGHSDERRAEEEVVADRGGPG